MSGKKQTAPERIQCTIMRIHSKGFAFIVDNKTGEEHWLHVRDLNDHLGWREGSLVEVTPGKRTSPTKPPAASEAVLLSMPNKRKVQ